MRYYLGREPQFRVDIDGRIYEGCFRNQGNAVFSAMRIDENAYDKGSRRYNMEAKLISVEQIDPNERLITKKMKLVGMRHE